MKKSRSHRLSDGSVNWHNLYYDLMPKFMTNGSLPGGSYNRAYYLIHPWKYAEDLYYQAKWFIQRGHRGYSDRDMWGWFSHHSQIMVGVLRDLRRTTHGHPLGLTPGKWDKKLRIMQEGFQAVIDEDNDFTSYKKLSRKAHLKLVYGRRRKTMLGLKYFREYYYSLWD